MNAAKDSIIVPTSELKSQDRLVQYIATTSGSIFSMAKLEAAIAIKNTLIKKHKELDRSLDKILNI
jgi:hypothetical protein